MVMLLLRKAGRRTLLIVFLALAGVGLWAAVQIQNARETGQLLNMTRKTKTLCVGRFLIDLPIDAQVNLSGERLDGFKVESVEESESAFLQREAARELQISKATGDTGGARVGGIVEARDLRIPAMIGRVLIYGRNQSYAIKKGIRVDDEWVSIEANAHAEGVSVSLKMDYADAHDAKAAAALLARLKVRHRDEIPSAPGFCTERAVFIEAPAPQKTGHVSMHIGFADHPDIALTFGSMPGGRSGEPTLLMRHAEMNAQAGAEEWLRVTNLRSAPRAVNGIRGEEVLERVREFNLATTYGFMWEALGVADDPLQPYLSLELHGGINPRPGGKPVDTSLHTDAVLALWDSILSSIRVRPSTPPALSTAQR